MLPRWEQIECGKHRPCIGPGQHATIFPGGIPGTPQLFLYRTALREDVSPYSF